MTGVGVGAGLGADAGAPRPGRRRAPADGRRRGRRRRGRAGLRRSRRLRDGSSDGASELVHFEPPAFGARLRAPSSGCGFFASGFTVGCGVPRAVAPSGLDALRRRALVGAPARPRSAAAARRAASGCARRRCHGAVEDVLELVLELLELAAGATRFEALEIVVASSFCDHATSTLPTSVRMIDVVELRLDVLEARPEHGRRRATRASASYSASSALVRRRRSCAPGASDDLRLRDALLDDAVDLRRRSGRADRRSARRDRRARRASATCRRRGSRRRTRRAAVLGVLRGLELLAQRARLRDRLVADAGEILPSTISRVDRRRARSRSPAASLVDRRERRRDCGLLVAGIAVMPATADR